MKYLKQFNDQLKSVRESKGLTLLNIAEYCLVDPSVVKTWESQDTSVRCYPSLDNLLDLCFSTGLALEKFIDLPSQQNDNQLDLPGISVSSEVDINASLSELDEAIDKIVPSEDEIELLRRYRKSDQQSKELILQLIV